MTRPTLALLGCVLALSAACSRTANPVSPSTAVPGSGAAGPNGETLKIGAPGTTSPVNGATGAFPLTLTVANVTGTYTAFPVTYRYEIRNAAGTTVATGTQAGSSGSATSIVVSTTLAFDSPHTWRVRAENSGAFGPWSPAASFRTPAGSFMRGNEVLDLLYDGKTVGEVRGPVTFSADGAKMNDSTAYIAYALPITLEDGEFSMMATNVDEGNPGDKLKIMSMGEGCHTMMTDNDYRMTLEVRGSFYTEPGAVQWRMINGDAADHDYITDSTGREGMSWTRSAWYFFKMFWDTNGGGFEIREGGPTGPIVMTQHRSNNGHAYRPAPHCVYVGSSFLRAGIQDQTHHGMVARNVWVSPNARPTFPAIIGKGQ